MVVKQGDKVKVEYTGTFEDGTVFDSSEKHGEPLEFESGAKQVIKGFDDAIMGMDVNEEKEVTIQPEDAYGHPNPALVQEVPKEQIPIKEELKAGMVLGVTLPTGEQIPAKIAEVNEKTVKMDLNHPLAGKVLKFKFKVVSIN